MPEHGCEQAWVLLFIMIISFVEGLRMHTAYRIIADKTAVISIIFLPKTVCQQNVSGHPPVI